MVVSARSGACLFAEIEQPTHSRRESRSENYSCNDVTKSATRRGETAPTASPNRPDELAPSPFIPRESLRRTRSPHSQPRARRDGIDTVRSHRTQRANTPRRRFGGSAHPDDRHQRVPEATPSETVFRHLFAVRKRSAESRDLAPRSSLVRTVVSHERIDRGTARDRPGHRYNSPYQ
jgi:hypothetical protein